jgi:hypothetical protein
MSKAKHDNSRRVAPAPAQKGRIPQRKHPRPSLPLVGAGAFQLELVDLDQHPDGKLLRACAEATKLRDKLGGDGGINGSGWTTEQQSYFEALDIITDTEALTSLGLQMKAIFVMGDNMDPFEHSPMFLYASVIRDFLRMGVPA